MSSLLEKAQFNKVRIADLADFKPPPPQTENHAMDIGSSTSTIEHGSIPM